MIHWYVKVQYFKTTLLCYLFHENLSQPFTYLFSCSFCGNTLESLIEPERGRFLSPIPKKSRIISSISTHMLGVSTSFGELIFPVSTTRSYINFKRLQHNLKRLSDKSAGQCRRPRRCRFDPWGGKIPWKRKWQPTPVFLPGEFYGQRSLVGYSPWAHKELDMTE